jgi:anti-sigma B factor antagonist
MTSVVGAKEIVIVELPAKVDSVTARDIQQSMTDAVVPGARIVVDGTAVTYMSAAGVRALATVLRLAETRRARVVFCSFTGPAADCLVVAGFARLLDVVDSRQDAFARLQSKPTG